MRAMILAAGRGSRMKELTDELPKALLPVHGRFLIEYNLLALKKAGISEIVINVSYHAEKIMHALGNGNAWGVSIQYSYEKEALETGGGVIQALPMLGDDPFIVISTDVLMNFDLKKLIQMELKHKAHLVMVPNPPFHPAGDFGLNGSLLSVDHRPFFTMASFGLYHPALFQHYPSGFLRLGKVFHDLIQEKNISGEVFTGAWFNLGTKEDWLDVCTLPTTHPVFQGNARPSECNPPDTPEHTAAHQSAQHIPCIDPD